MGKNHTPLPMSQTPSGSTASGSATVSVRDVERNDELSKQEEKVLSFLSPMSSQDFRFSMSQEWGDFSRMQEGLMKTSNGSPGDSLFPDSLLTRRTATNDVFQYQSQELSSSQQT